MQPLLLGHHDGFSIVIISSIKQPEPFFNRGWTVECLGDKLQEWNAFMIIIVALDKILTAELWKALKCRRGNIKTPLTESLQGEREENMIIYFYHFLILSAPENGA